MPVRWRAVGFGVAVVVLLAFLAFLLPVAGHLAVGLAGGFVAGLLAGGGTRSGATHGAAAGLAGGGVLLVAGVAVALSLGVPTVLGGLFGVSRAGFAGLQVAGAVAAAAAAAGGGALGGAVRGDRPLPSEPSVRRE